MDSDKIADSIKAKAKSLGLLECEIIPATSLNEEKEPFLNWLNNNLHAGMSYMARNVEKRLDPRLLYENAKTIIVVLQNYFPTEIQTDYTAPVLSKYAYGIDYHFVLKEKLNKLLAFIKNEVGDCNGRAFVDSAPVLEHAWAKRAGLGWTGKNSLLLSKKHGSFFFIGELILDIELPFSKINRGKNYCGNCTRCIDACPTQAIIANGVVDAKKCISYQTIENRGDIDKSLKGKLNNRIFGCDICQDVCPWNSKPIPHSEPAFNPNKKLLALSKNEWHTMEKPLFNELFKNSPVLRTGFKKLKQNLDFLND